MLHIHGILGYAAASGSDMWEVQFTAAARNIIYAFAVFLY